MNEEETMEERNPTKLESLLTDFAMNVTDRDGEVCSYRDPVFVQSRMCVEHYIESTLKSQQERLVGEIDKLKPPVSLMQDGVSFDYSFYDGYNTGKLHSKNIIKKTL